MKNGIKLFILFSALVVQTQSFSPLGFGHQSFVSVSKTTNSINRVTRDEGSDRCEGVMQDAINEQFCSTSFGQNYVNRVNQCGPDIGLNSDTLALVCGKNSAGEFCGSINFTNALSNCNSSLTGSTCPTECYKTLTDAGCCFSRFNFLVDLFTLCDIDFPSPCPETSLTIPPITSDNPSCQTEEDISRLYMEFTCSVASPIVYSLNSNNCPSFARNFELQCSMQDGESCSDSAADNSTLNELTSAAVNCPSISECSTSCETSLRNLNKNFGCCLNLHNSSYTIGTEYFDSDSPFTTILDNDLWQECGITPPGACLFASSSAAVGNIVFIILSVTFYFICTM